MSDPIDPDSPEFKEWAAKKMAEILSLEEQGRLAEESPPEELKEIFRILDYDVAPLFDAGGVPITREELEKMFADWFVRRKAAPPQGMQAGREREGKERAPKHVPTSTVGRFLDRLSSNLGRPVKRGLRLIGIIIMLVPLVLLPAYFLIYIQLPPPVATGVMTLTPTVPLIAPGQTQNYSVLTLTQPNPKVTVPTTLTAFSPQGLSFDISSTYLPSQGASRTPVVVHASSALSPGPYQVTVEEREGSAVKNQTFTIKVVPALVVMEHLAFVPQYLNVTKGTTVYWMNLDSQIGCCDPGIHDVDISAIHVESPYLSTFQTWSYSFADAGDFYYICSIHPFMTAEVTVIA